MEELIEKILKMGIYSFEQEDPTALGWMKQELMKGFEVLIKEREEAIIKKLEDEKYYNPEPLTNNDSYNHALDDAISAIKEKNE